MSFKKITKSGDRHVSLGRYFGECNVLLEIPQDVFSNKVESVWSIKLDMLLVSRTCQQIELTIVGKDIKNIEEPS